MSAAIDNWTCCRGNRSASVSKVADTSPVTHRVSGSDPQVTSGAEGRRLKDGRVSSREFASVREGCLSRRQNRSPASHPALSYSARIRDTERHPARDGPPICGCRADIEAVFSCSPPWNRSDAVQARCYSRGGVTSPPVACRNRARNRYIRSRWASIRGGYFQPIVSSSPNSLPTSSGFALTTRNAPPLVIVICDDPPANRSGRGPARPTRSPDRPAPRGPRRRTP